MNLLAALGLPRRIALISPLPPAECEFRLRLALRNKGPGVVAAPAFSGDANDGKASVHLRTRRNFVSRTWMFVRFSPQGAGAVASGWMGFHPLQWILSVGLIAITLLPTSLNARIGAPNTLADNLQNHSGGLLIFLVLVAVFRLLNFGDDARLHDFLRSTIDATEDNADAASPTHPGEGRGPGR